MKIAAAAVSLASTHAFHEEQTREESLRFWLGNERPVFAGEENPAAAQVRISLEARQPEQISGLAAGSGFLALDRNQDGRINNGLELFGPATGQGFGELARLDSDGNGWLDENDPLYAQLRVWMRDEAGNESLGSLAEKKVGAVLLASVQTAFALKDSGNTLQGQLRETSIYLGENGGTGTVQEIDLAV